MWTLEQILDQLFFGPPAWVAAGLYLFEFLRTRERPEGVFVLNFVIQLAIALALLVLSYLLAPKPKAPQPEATKDFEAPTSEAGRPIPVVFGTKTVKSPNVLWYGDKKIFTDKVKA